MADSWLPTLVTPTAEAGFERAAKLSPRRRESHPAVR